MASRRRIGRPAAPGREVREPERQPDHERDQADDADEPEPDQDREHGRALALPGDRTRVTHPRAERMQRVMAGEFSGKPSTPYGAATVHDFMHAKITVADDIVFVGSFNLSRSGEQNAENVLELHDSTLADDLSAYVDEVRHRYPRFQLPG